MPVGNVALPPLRDKALSVLPAVKPYAPLSVPCLLSPDESISDGPAVWLARYQAVVPTMLTIVLAVNESFTAVIVALPAPGGAVNTPADETAPTLLDQAIPDVPMGWPNLSVPK